MSQHPSLKSKAKGTKHRSVLKRFERLKHLVEKEKWTDETSIYNLPKIKVVKFKIKKEKAAAEAVPGEAGAVAAAPAGTTAPQAEKGAGKQAAPGKAIPQAKEAPKKEEAKGKK